MFPATLMQWFGHGCTMMGSQGVSRGQDLDHFIYSSMGGEFYNCSVIAGLSKENAGKKNNICTTFNIQTVLWVYGGSVRWTSKGFTKPVFRSTGACAEGGDQTLRFILLKGVRLLLPFGRRAGDEPLSMYPHKCYLRPALEANRQGNTRSLGVILSLPRREIRWRPQCGLPRSGPAPLSTELQRRLKQ